MSSDSGEVRALLSALLPKVQSCRESLDSQAVGNALYGLQGMSSDSGEVRALLSALLPKVQSCKESLNAQAVGNALYGLQGSLRSLLSRPLVDFLFLHFLKLVAPSPSLQLLSIVDMVSLGQGVVLSLPALRDSLSDGEYMKWEETSALLCGELVTRQHEGHSRGGFRSNAERRMYNVSAKALEKSGLLVSSNEHLFDLFESDVVVRIPRDGGDCLIVNIEVDGVHHLREKKKRFCMLRDEYLKSKGVVVMRVTVSRLREMKDEEVEDWVLDKVASAMLSVVHTVE
jgi:hypothetical protein